MDHHIKAMKRDGLKLALCDGGNGFIVYFWASRRLYRQHRANIDDLGAKAVRVKDIKEEDKNLIIHGLL